jgi:hypothetical protein
MPCASARIIERGRKIFYTRRRNETNADPSGHLLAWRVCHGSRAGQRAEHVDRRDRFVRPRRDLGNGRRLQSLCASANALSVRHIAERRSNGVRLRIRSAQRSDLPDFGWSRGCDNGTGRQHRREHSNQHAQRHVGRWWFWRRLIKSWLLGRDIVNGRRRRRRSLRRHRRVLAVLINRIL